MSTPGILMQPHTMWFAGEHHGRKEGQACPGHRRPFVPCQMTFPVCMLNCWQPGYGFPRGLPVLGFSREQNQQDLCVCVCVHVHVRTLVHTQVFYEELANVFMGLGKPRSALWASGFQTQESQWSRLKSKGSLLENFLLFRQAGLFGLFCLN